MLKSLLICAYSVYLLFPQSNPYKIRHQLQRAVNSSRVTDSLYDRLNSINDKTPLELSYIGALEALKAKHAWNPYSKLKYLKRSEGTLAKAVTAEPHNMEIRFMRFSVEYKVPGFLGDKKHLYTDREEIITQIKQGHYTTDDKQMVITISRFLLNSKTCTAAENTYLSEALSRLL